MVGTLLLGAIIVNFCYFSTKFISLFSLNSDFCLLSWKQCLEIPVSHQQELSEAWILACIKLKKPLLLWKQIPDEAERGDQERSVHLVTRDSMMRSPKFEGI